jgi:hypothetical protein
VHVPIRDCDGRVAGASPWVYEQNAAFEKVLAARAAHPIGIIPPLTVSLAV